jgi:hypothetical protein
MAEPHVQLILDRSYVPPSLQKALNRLRARVSIRSLNKALNGGVSNSADVCLVLTDTDQSSDTLDRILRQSNERACAMMVVTPEGITTPREPGIDTRLRAADAPATTDELAGRIRALCEIRRPMR